MEKKLKEYYSLFKSDKKITGGKEGTCILCGQNKKLVLGHIAPKWCYHWAKKEDHGRIIGDYMSLGVRVVNQDGSKHYILCNNCDQFIGDSENYIKTLMHGSENDKKKLNIVHNNDNYTGLNCELIQRFVFGLTLKSHFASSAPFHKIFVAKNIIKDLRDRILHPINDDINYPIIAMRFHSLIIPKIDPKAMMIPMQQKNDNGELLSFLLGGWEWIIFFNQNHLLNLKMAIDMRLLCDGSMYIPSSDIINQRFIRKKIEMSTKKRR